VSFRRLVVLPLLLLLAACTHATEEAPGAAPSGPGTVTDLAACDAVKQAQFEVLNSLALAKFDASMVMEGTYSLERAWQHYGETFSKADAAVSEARKSTRDPVLLAYTEDAATYLDVAETTMMALTEKGARSTWTELGTMGNEFLVKQKKLTGLCA
jgi:hypothetical protein